MRSNDCVMTARMPSSVEPLAAQSRDEPVPYSLFGEDDERHAFGFVLHRSVVHGHALLRWIMDRVSAFDARHHLVLDAECSRRCRASSLRDCRGACRIG
jgi:hypothetical protein